MSSRNREVIRESLIKKGFIEKDGGDHMYFTYYSLKGKKTAVHTKMSRGSKYKSINDNLLSLMSRQCKLSKSDFLDLIDCPLTRENYQKKLEEQSIGL